MSGHTRRALLAAATAGLAGCLGDVSGPGTRTDGPATTDAGDAPTVDWVQGDWTHPRGDAAGTRSDPAGRVTDEAPRVAWTAEYGGEWGSLAVADGRVVVVDRGTLLALDTSTGETLWRRSLPPDADIAGPVLAGDLLVGVGPELRALSPATGERRWSATPGTGTVEHVAAGDGVTFVTTEGRGDTEGAIHAVRKGEVGWTFRTDEVPVARFGTLALGPETVYAVGVSSGSVTWHHAIDASSGVERWRADGLNHSTALTVAEGTVLAGGFYGQVVAQSAEDGSERWERELRPAVRQLAVADGRVYAASSADEDGSLVALSLSGGETAWRGRGHGVAAAGDGVVAAENHTLRGVDASSGDERWARDGVSAVRALALADGAVVVAGEDGVVRLLTS